MTRTKYTLQDVGGRLGWAALSHFVRYVLKDPKSALWCEMFDKDGDKAGWYDGTRVAPMLADLYDLVSWFRWSFSASHVGRRAKRPKPYPRPWVDDGTRHIGKDPIPISEFDEWWASN